MALVAPIPNQSTFSDAPQGNHQAICIDVIDRGVEETKFGEKHRVQFVYELGKKDKDGSPYLIWSRRYNLSMHKSSSLRGFLEAWRGEAFKEEDIANPDPAKRFDIERVLGVNCLLNIIHTEENQQTFVNIQSISPLVEGMTKIKQTSKYVRMCDREEALTPSGDGAATPAPQPAPVAAAPTQDFSGDDGLPF